MPTSRAKSSQSERQGLAEAYGRQQRMIDMALCHLDPAAWRAAPSAGAARGERTIAAVMAHIHNIRRKWLRLSTALPLPAPLHRSRCTQQEAGIALAESAALCQRMILEADAFRRDGWAKPWPIGAEMAAYMIAHDAHHLGQVCLLAHHLGWPLPSSAVSRMWAWERDRGSARS